MAEGYGTPGSTAICPSLGESSSAPVGVSLLYAYMVLHEYNIFWAMIWAAKVRESTHTAW